MCLNQARYGIAWGAIGAAMACYDTALNYAKNRIQFGKPIASFQLVQEKLVYMVTEITKAQLLALQLGRLKERGEARFDRVSLAKRNNVAMALQIARMARDILGANGITSEYPVGRHMTNLESVYHLRGDPRHPHPDRGGVGHGHRGVSVERLPVAAGRTQARAVCSAVTISRWPVIPGLDRSDPDRGMTSSGRSCVQHSCDRAVSSALPL